MEELEPITMVEIVKKMVVFADDGRVLSIPVRLSGIPNETWIDVFTKAWEHPPAYSTKHGTGGVRIVANLLYADGVSMEALRDDQKCAIELCIAKANEETPKILVKQAQKEAAESESAERRRKAALDIADQIDFGGQVRPE